MKSKPLDVPEEVRLIIFDSQICSDVGEAFWANGIAAYGDFRYHRPQRDLVHDALNDGINYIVIHNASSPDNSQNRCASIRDLLVEVYFRNDGTQKTMRISAVIELVKQRRSA